MINETTVSKLNDMRLAVMADTEPSYLIHLIRLYLSKNVLA
jgi:hypothetical protein